MKSWRARIAFRSDGKTVLSYPTMPGRSGSLALRRRIRFRRISSLTGTAFQPEDLSSPTVDGLLEATTRF